MGKIQYIVYSVGKNFDFKFVVKSDFLPESVWDRFKEQIIGSVQTDNIVGSLDSPRWLFSRYKGYTLWGIATYNAHLASEDKYATDYVGRSGQQLRVFLGLVCEGEMQCLPIDLNFFKSAYKDLIEPRWEASLEDTDYCQTGRPVLDSFDNYNVVQPQPLISLNADNEKVRFCHGQKDIFEYMASALATTGDISCMGMIKQGHKGFAEKKKYHYHNVVVEGQDIDEERALKDESKKRTEQTANRKTSTKPIAGHNDGAKGKENHGAPKDDMSKKAMASVGIIILVLALLIMLWIKKR